MDKVEEGSAPNIPWRVWTVNIWFRITKYGDRWGDLLTGSTDEENFVGHV